MSLRSLTAQLNESTDRLIPDLFSWSSDQHGNGLETYIIAGLMLNRHYSDITRQDITNAIADLHTNNDADASDLAERLDRWYYDSLIEFRIRSS